MPIKVQDGLPAVNQLESENIFVMTQTRAATQDIRPLQIAFVNLMPKKIVTETQILRYLSNRLSPALPLKISPLSRWTTGTSCAK